jgi:transcriptional regulator with XRE-family HTH domain
MADLRTERQRAGLTREQLAVKANITIGTIYRIETGKNMPLMAVRQVIAQALGLSVDAIDWTGKKAEKA